MKITSDTHDLLVIDDRPLLLGIALSIFILIFVGVGLAVLLDGVWAGLIFIIVGGGLGLGAFWAFVERVQVVFHRPEAWVEFRRRNIFGGQRVRHGLNEIDHAEVEETSSSEGGSLWRVVLVIAEGQSMGRHPVTLAFSNGSEHHVIADAINRWLAAARAAQEA